MKIVRIELYFVCKDEISEKALQEFVKRDAHQHHLNGTFPKGVDFTGSSYEIFKDARGSRE